MAPRAADRGTAGTKGLAFQNWGDAWGSEREEAGEAAGRHSGSCMCREDCAACLTDYLAQTRCYLSAPAFAHSVFVSPSSVIDPEQGVRMQRGHLSACPGDSQPTLGHQGHPLQVGALVEVM